MYRPHEAREDTVLFRALNKIVPVKRLKELGEEFEKEEDRLFGGVVRESIQPLELASQISCSSVRLVAIKNLAKSVLNDAHCRIAVNTVE
jgi:hypothetical protein